MGQELRVYTCLLALLVGGAGGGLLLDGTIGEQDRERERARARAAGRDGIACGGGGLPLYMTCGFVLGIVPTAWALVRLGAVRWIKAATPPPVA